MSDSTKNNEQMVESVQSKRAARDRNHTFWLRDLGLQYRIERNEDWGDCQGIERSYGEMIRVRNSRATARKEMSPVTGSVHDQQYGPSNVSKYSESHLILHMKDHQRTWKPLAVITGEDFSQGLDRYEEEFIFPIEKFPEICGVVKFRERRRISVEQREALRERMVLLRVRRRTNLTGNHRQNDASLSTNLRTSNEESENVRP